MANVEEMWKILKRDYGIQSIDELKAAMATNHGINIAIFTQNRRKNYGRSDATGTAGIAGSAGDRSVSCYSA